MEFRILGPLEVIDGGRSIELGPPKQRALLALLLIHANRVVSLDRLIDQLWGEEPPAAATSSLQAYVSHLRRVLEPERSPRDPARVLVTQPPGYALRVDPSDIDAVRFEAGLAEGRRLLSEDRPRAAHQVLGEALGLWRGDALAEFIFEPFAQAEVRRLEELRSAAIEDRILADLALGHHAEAVPELEALVAEHPLRERLWALLMLALYRSGRQGEALRAYQAARKHLAEQLGVEPGVELRRLEAEVLAQDPSLQWHPAEERPEPSAPPRPEVAVDVPPPHLAGAPLVGRGPHLARLGAALEDAVGGRGRIVLLLGDPGIGKTRLAREIAAVAEARGTEVAWGGAYEGGGAPSFWPWVQLLRPLVAAADAQELRESLGAGAGDVAQLLPEVKELLPGLEPPPSLDPDTARFRLYEALSALLLARARRTPLLVVLDDLHWADDATLRLLGFLAPRLRAAPILVVGTYRPLEVDAAHPLSETLAALARHEVVERVVLSGLGHDEVKELIAATIGGDPARDLVVAVHDRTAGNPFFVSELVRLMASEGALDLGRDAKVVIPAGVGDVIRRRLARLPDETNSLLVLAAVVGREFDLAELAAAAGVDLDRAIEGLEPAVLTGVLVEDDEVIARFRFSHVLVQDTIYRGLTAVRRARLHAGIGQALEDLYGQDDDEHASELARHFSLAAHAGEAERAHNYAVLAAEVSMRRFAYDQAEAHLRSALNALALLPAGPERDRRELDVQTRRALVLALTRGYAATEVGDASTRARDLSHRLGDTAQAMSSLWSLWGLSVVMADFDAAAGFGRQLLELGERTADGRSLLGGHQALGTTAVHRGDLVAGREHLERAVALADSLADRSLADVFYQHPSVFSRGFAAIAAWLAGETEAAVTLCRDALRIAHELDHPFSVTVALFFDAFVGVFLGDWPLVARQAGEAIDLSEQRGFALFSAMSSVFRGWARANQGDADAGCAEIAGGLARMEETRARMLRHFFLGLLADGHWRGGRRAEALAAVEEALAEASAVGERFYEPELHRLRAEFLPGLGANPTAEVRQALSRSLALARAQGARALELRALKTLRRLGGP